MTGMRVFGIVAEFDPFHKGHEYLIRQARERGATHIAVVMSGAAVQRGEPAVCSKHERAEAALNCGADLVAELPAPFSCSMAKFFGSAAVHILGQLCIDALCFGSETDDPGLILAAAKAMNDLEDSESVRRRLDSGMSYPAALHAAAAELCGEETVAVLASPNSTLGVEYVRALMAQGIRADVLPVKRFGSEHDKKGGALPSGSELRELLAAGCDISGKVPDGCAPRVLYDPARADDILLYHLLTADKDELLRLPELNAPIADRILKARRDPPDTLSGFLAAVKSANITMARLRRSALHLALAVTRKDIIFPPFVRVLAFNARGAEILRRARGDIPVSTSLRDIADSSPAAARIAAVEQRAVYLQQLCRVTEGKRFENEYTRKIVIKK